MEESHIRRRKGRFIKKTDPLRKGMSISDFNLMDICETEITYADNLASNIIHSKLHLQESIEAGVKASQEIENIFEPAEYRPVIKPLDFTQEWIKQKSRMTNRQSRHDDDDDVDAEMENIAKKLKSKFSKQLEKQEKASALEEIKEIGHSLKFEESIDSQPSSILDTLGQELQPNIDQQDASQNIGEEIRDTKPTAQEPMKHVADAINEIAPNQVIEEPLNTNHELPSVPVSNHKTIEEDFVPLSPDKNTPPLVSEKEKQEILESAKSKGYEDGYKIGEEKAMIVIQDRVNIILNEFASIMSEIEGMKSNILLSAQDNFRVVCQSMMESLLQKEFSLNASSFEAMVERAIAEAVPDDEFKVLVSQETYERVKDDIGDSLKTKLKVDQSIEDSNFKIESKLSVVDGNISQIIDDLLEQADLNLFETKDDQDDKVG